MLGLPSAGVSGDQLLHKMQETTIEQPSPYLIEQPEQPQIEPSSHHAYRQIGSGQHPIHAESEPCEHDVWQLWTDYRMHCQMMPWPTEKGEES
jgi:hypothetical protein